jgi:2-polyprenyl-6-methoxyphenol hydroxylase-like FAD-dependent oxidoreductase
MSPRPDHVDHDIIVVGARCAGAGTALLLARAGLDVLVLDRAPATGDTLSTHALLRAGVLQLARWGVLDRVVSAGTPPVRRSTFHLADGDVPISIKPYAGVDAFYAPRRSVLDAILVDEARAAGAAVVLGVRVTGLLRDGDRVTGVRTVDAAGRAATATARIVVGADGRDSTVAGAVESTTYRLATAASDVAYGYVTGVPADGYRWWFRRGRSAGLIPTNGGEHCLFVAGHPAVLGDGAPGPGLVGAALAVAPELREVIEPTRPVRGSRRHAGRPGYLRRPWGPGWALVGDAGYLKDPITAHGMSDALRDAELLARAIVELHEGAAEDAALGGYHELRDQLSVPLFDVAERLAAHTWSDAEVRDQLRQLSSATTDEVEHLVGLGPLPAIRTHAVA